MMSDTLLLFLNLAGIGFFAISGTLLGERKNVNGFGITVLATLTATGGGTIRDLLLNKPVFWIEDSIYLLTNFVAIMVSILFIRRFPSPDNRYFLIVDAAGLALFNIIGIFKATQAGADLVVALTMGVITSVFGGILRDVICREVPVTLKNQLYATTCIAGGLTYVVTTNLGWNTYICVGMAFSTTFVMRMSAIYEGWRLQIFSQKSNG